MRPPARFAAAVSAALLATASALVAFALPAQAATLAVTTTDDVVNGGDGVLSLREAIDAANADAATTTIELVAATTYELDLCDGDDNDEEDANASGDLDHSTDQALTINGHGATIEQSCAGERILHTTSAATTVTLTDVTLTGGAGDGAAVNYAGDLVISGSTVAGNNSGPFGTLNSASGMSGASLNLSDSTVGPNTGRGVGGPFGTAVTITDSTITQNTGDGVDLTDGTLSVSGSTITDNGEDGLRTTGQGEGLLTITGTQVIGNGGTGIDCSNCGDLQLTDSVVTGNLNGGVAISVDQDEATDDLTATVTRTSVVDNTRDGFGAGLRVTITELVDEAPMAQILVDRSTFAGNEATGANGRGGAIYAATGEVRLTNSTVSGNSASVSGGAIYTSTSDIFLQHATLVENTAPTGSHIATGEDLHSFGSIVSAGLGGGECAIAGTTTSGGYNVGGDGSCAFTGTGDQNSAGSANLGPLQGNGGPTQTRLPLAGSPALGAVPAAACTVSTMDQRGVARPQGTDCEAGAVEVSLDQDLADTGQSVTGVVIAGAGLLVVGGLILGLLALRGRRRTS
jgi:predicted outer membrane repeat protein